MPGMINLAARARKPEDARKCIDLGFKILEITLPCPGGDHEEAFWRQTASHERLRFLGHGPEEGNPTDTGHFKSNYLPRLLQAVQAAARLDCGILTVHCWLDERWIKPDIAETKTGLLACVAEYGRKSGVSVCLENLSESAECLAGVLKSIPSLSLTVDLGHAQLLHDRNTAPDFIDQHFHRIRHLHLHDNHGGNNPKSDLHLVPGDGIVPFPLIFRKLKEKNYDGTGTLELKPEELDEGRKRVHAIWNAS